MRIFSVCFAAASVVALSCAATAQVAILQIRVIEGEGAVHAPGSRSTRPLTVEVTDETGKPVEGAAVTFHLPEDGPGGVFANGMRTDVAVTDSHGHASLHGLQLNRAPGRFQIRIVASKEQARAGMVSFQYIAEPGSGAASAKAGSPRGYRKWIVVAALACGGAAAGLLAAGRSGSTPPPAASPVPPVPTPTVTLTIGPPTITVGKP
ncbi:MAG: hypothetical protein ABSH44_09285 [Bryobacteraceae bacterium]